MEEDLGQEEGEDEEDAYVDKGWVDMEREMNKMAEEEITQQSEENHLPHDGSTFYPQESEHDDDVSVKVGESKNQNGDTGQTAESQPETQADIQVSNCTESNMKIITTHADSHGEMSVSGNPGLAYKTSPSGDGQMPQATFVQVSQFDTKQFAPVYANMQQMPINVMPTSSPYPPAIDGTKNKTLVFRPSEYKKSERGLSFLFPSLADQQLSLLDKVKITVMRHKSNYFLNWKEEELMKVDPMVRPKLVVTKELYKEYCHRNAMKYDSNLQYAMESPETWAQDFRDRLSKPPSEGGFHSLCEVKQEAGRLWKEYSGKYKMHNVVKAQMDLNNERSAYMRKGSRARHKTQEKVVPPAVTDTSRTHFISRIRSASSSPGMEELHSPSSLAASPNSAMSVSSTPARSSRSANSSPVSMQRPLTQVSPSSTPGGMPYREAIHFPHTPSGSPYSSSNDLSISMDDSRKRRRNDDGYGGSTESSPRVLEENGEHLWKQPRLVAEGEDRKSEGDGTPAPAGSPFAQRPINWKAPNLNLSQVTLSQARMPFTVAHHQGEQPSQDVPQEGILSDPHSECAIEGLDSVDTLFVPLPSHLSVAQQLAIWLQRHTNNYYLGISKEHLLTLDPLLQPHMMVTEETYRRFISNSMVCMFDRVGKIMASSASWAKMFQDRVHKKPHEGGFMNVEEALSEAVDLWKQNVEVEEDSMNRGEQQAAVYVPSDQPVSGRLPYMEQETQHSQPSPAHQDKMLCLPGGAPFKMEPGTAPSLGEPPPHLVQPPATPDLSHQALDLTVTSMPGGSTVPCTSATHSSSPNRNAAILQHTVWRCRERLHHFCRDDPISSWQERLHPYIGTLRDKLGEDYTCPQRVSDCMVDLLLAVLSEELSCN